MSKKRSIISMVAALCLVFSLVALTGCNQNAQKDSKAFEQASASAQATAEKTDYDVIVVGAGGAGMTAALSAHESGASVVVLEKTASPGGNTSFSSSGMNASETKFEKEQGIEDSNALFAEETIKGGHGKNNVELVNFMADHSAAAIDWLDQRGIRLDNLTITGGFSVKRCHRPTDGSAVGGVLVDGLEKNIKSADIPVLTDHKVTEIVMDGNKVVGVKAQTKDGSVKEYKGKAVVIASGGFAANAEMVEHYQPDYKGMVTTNPTSSQGEGMVMAEKVGADLIDMQYIQIHPTVEQKTQTLIAEGIRGAGAILMNQKGERFINEMETRDVVSAAELKQEGKFAYEILDDKIRQDNKAVDKYIKAKLVVQSDTLAGLAKELGIDPAVFEKTVADYNAAAEAGSGDPLGRSTGLAPLKTGPFYAIKVAPGVHHTMGGIKVDTQSRALTKDNTPISGLYAAGEVTGGIHGANRIGGNAVCDIIVFGRNAGTQAAEFAKSVN